jgi:hypothetical protein
MAAGNTDAHLKNFGLVYADLSDVRLAPMFDRVTTKVYAPYRSASRQGWRLPRPSWPPSGARAPSSVRGARGERGPAGGVPPGTPPGKRPANL